jgi:hypothetical protein
MWHKIYPKTRFLLHDGAVSNKLLCVYKVFLTKKRKEMPMLEQPLEQLREIHVSENKFLIESVNFELLENVQESMTTVLMMKILGK